MKLAYQQLEFDEVVYVEGFNRESEYAKIFPEPPIGKVILDIGCHNSFYILQACYDGAARGFGVEKDFSWAEKGREVAEAIGLSNVYICNNDIEKITLTGIFDVVLCLNLLHHFRSIERIQAIMDKMDSVCGERMVFVVIDPSDPVASWSHERTSRGAIKTRLSWMFFQNYWPDYEVRRQPTTVNPVGRSIVEVIKKEVA